MDAQPAQELPTQQGRARACVFFVFVFAIVVIVACLVGCSDFQEPARLGQRQRRPRHHEHDHHNHQRPIASHQSQGSGNTTIPTTPRHSPTILLFSVPVLNFPILFLILIFIFLLADE
jgi:hypothetical protein